MRKVKKALIPVLILAVCLTCTGCGAVQTQMAKTAARMAKVQNFHTDVEAYVGALLNIGGQKVRMEATVTGGLETETDPFLIRTDLLLKTLGVERELRFHILKDNDKWIVNPGDETVAVNEENEEQQAAEKSRTTQELKLLIKCGEYFAEPVDDLVNGAHAKRYDGMFPDEYVDEVLVLLGLKEKEESVPSEAAVIIPEGSEESGAEIQEDEATKETEEKKMDAEDTDPDAGGESVAEEAQEAPTGLPGSIWINDDNMIVQVDIDLAVFLQKLVDEGLNKVLADYGLDGLELDCQLQYVDARLTFSNFDEMETPGLSDA